MNFLDFLITSPHCFFKKVLGQDRRIFVLILGLNRDQPKEKGLLNAGMDLIILV